MTKRAHQLKPGERYRVFLDEVEIDQVFYVDRRRKRVRTFDILGTGAVHVVEGFEKLGIPIDPSWKMEGGKHGVFYKELRGRRVRLEPIV